MNARAQRTLFDLTQDGLVIGQKLQRIYPAFDTHAFAVAVRTEMKGQTIYKILHENHFFYRIYCGIL